LSKAVQRGDLKPPQSGRPLELRYRLADFVNDRLKALPGVHRALKSLFSDVPTKQQDTPPTPALRQGPPVIPEVDPTQTSKPPDSSLQPTHAVELVADESSSREAAPADRLPYPPFEMRELVGATDLTVFDNPEGKLIFDYLEPKLGPEVYQKVFDFGCGCGRMARLLIQQRPRPELYVGVDLHEGMIRWCRKNLSLFAPNFSFHHHNVFNARFNPDPGLPSLATFPVPDSQFTLVIAHSVFTHLTEEQAGHYLRECARILAPEGVLYSSWFLFDKEDHPMMHDHDNALYVSYRDPSAVVLFGKQWLRKIARECGLKIFAVAPPGLRGYQWVVLMTRKQDVEEPDFPPDVAPRGLNRPPVGSGRDPSTIGREPE